MILLLLLLQATDAGDIESQNTVQTQVTSSLGS